MTVTPGRLVLVGGGHAHLFVLEGLARGELAARQVVLISPTKEQAYSGMVPGWIGGRYERDELVFDLPALARAAGAEFLRGRAARIDTMTRQIEVEGAGRIRFDVASVSIGSVASGTDLPGVAKHALHVKPIHHAGRIVPALEEAATANPALRIVVVGTGTAGFELALAVRGRLDTMLGDRRAEITLVGASEELVPDRAPAARRAAHRALKRNAVTVRLGATVEGAEPGQLRLAAESLPFDLLIWAAGPAAPTIFRDSGLATDDAGYLLVDDSLRSIADHAIFGAGDAITLRDHPETAKAGVYAVREGPILCDNLAAALRGEHPKSAYQPQPKFLALLNTGDGRAICSYGRFALTGRWAMQLKDRIDRAFMKRFRSLGSKRVKIEKK